MTTRYRSASAAPGDHPTTLRVKRIATAVATGLVVDRDRWAVAFGRLCPPPPRGEEVRVKM